MKYILLLLSFNLSFNLLNAQVLPEKNDSTDTKEIIVKGKVIDEKGVPISYVNVRFLHKSDSISIATSITDSEGSFMFKAPATTDYLLHFTFIGFEEKYLPAIEFLETPTSDNKNIITLKTDAKVLKEVSITSLRPTIVQLDDRLVVSVQGTALAAGNTAYDVLTRAPGVFIDAEGNIQLNGRSGVTVMLDGKLTFLSARDLKALLEGMPAENIKNIEIITNPSAKYDAEGTSGILNINFRKNTQNGMNGSVYSSYTYNFLQHGYSAGANINYKSGRWNSFLNMDFARRAGGREATFTRIFYNPNHTIYFDQVATGNFSSIGPPSVRFGTEYSLNANHNIGIILNYTRNTSNSDFLTETFIGNNPSNPTQFIDADNFSNNTFTNRTATLNYTYKIDSIGSTFSTDLDYVRISNRGESHFYNYFVDLNSTQKTQDLLYTYTPNDYDIYSAKADYVKPLKTGKIEAGGRISRVVSDNDFRFYFMNSGAVIDPKRTNHFNFREVISAAYANWNHTLSNKLILQLGLRAENTSSQGTSFTTGQVTERDYLNLFPSVFLQQKVNEDYSINYNYSRRLNRPNYGNLNPFRFYRDPYTYIEGNPFLRPQYINSFSLTQSYKKVYNVTLSYQQTKDVISELPILQVEDTTTIYTTGNVDNGHSIGMTGIAPLKITKWWDTQNTVVVTYNKFNMMSNFGELNNEQVFYMLQSNHTILLPKHFRLELNLLYRGPAASGLYHMAPMSRVSAGVRKSFMNKKIDVSINANDIFKGYRFYWTTDIGGHVNEFNQYMRWRNITTTIRYNFSKGQKTDSKRRSNNVEELNRT